MDGFGGCCTDTRPVFELAPPPGVAASFGFDFVENTAFIDSSPRTGGDYGITARTPPMCPFSGVRAARPSRCGGCRAITATIRGGATDVATLAGGTGRRSSMPLTAGKGPAAVLGAHERVAGPYCHGAG